MASNTWLGHESYLDAVIYIWFLFIFSANSFPQNGPIFLIFLNGSGQGLPIKINLKSLFIKQYSCNCE